MNYILNTLKLLIKPLKDMLTDMKKYIKRLFVGITLCSLMAMGAEGSLKAQDLALSTNMLSYLNLGTMSGNVSWGFSRHLSAEAAFRYNPFVFKGREGVADQMQSKQRTASLGMRFWPWHIHSGWWLDGKAQYQEFNIGGLTEAMTREGDRVGVGLTAGYTYMLSPHLNIEAGLGMWAGREWFTIYECPVCGKITDNGKKTFFLPDDILLGLVYVF